MTRLTAQSFLSLALSLPPPNPTAQDVAQAVLLAPLLPGPLRAGPVLRSHRVVRDGRVRHQVGGPGGAELQEAADHPGV